VKLTVTVKLYPTPDQADRLLRTLERANDAANYLSHAAWHEQTFGQYKLHKLAYADAREATGLTAQMVVRLIAKVADAYKLDIRRERRFRPHGSIAYDDRILRWYVDRDVVSIWTVEGRETIPFACGKKQRALLAMRQGESDLIYRNGNWLLSTTVNYEEPPPDESDDFLGVDLGIVNLAVDSDGTTYSGAGIERNRRIHAHRRRNLQRKGTRAARRKFMRLKGRQARFQRHINHVISKALVASAQGTGRGIACENLTGIRTRTTVKRQQRARHSNWAFFQLRSFLAYKAQKAGVRLVLVDQRNSSRECERCGHIAKANRRSQSSFLCESCGHAATADHNAARVLRKRARATVNWPMVSPARG
jgi:putative transposase